MQRAAGASEKFNRQQFEEGAHWADRHWYYSFFKLAKWENIFFFFQIKQYKKKRKICWSSDPTWTKIYYLKVWMRQNVLLMSIKCYQAPSTEIVATSLKTWVREDTHSRRAAAAGFPAFPVTCGGKKGDKPLETWTSCIFEHVGGGLFFIFLYFCFCAGRLKMSRARERVVSIFYKTTPSLLEEK